MCYRAFSYVCPRGCRIRRLASTGLVFFALSAGIDVQANPPVDTPRPAEQRTLELAALAARQHAAGGSASESLVNEMVAVAAERRRLLQNLIEHDAVEALRLALPERLRKRMPDQVKLHVEEHRELAGLLRVRYEHTGSEGHLVYELDTGTELLELHFANSPPRLQSDTRVRARGVVLDQSMAIASGDTGITLLNIDADGSGDTALSGGAVPTLSTTFGEQRTLVLLVNWLDDPANQPYSLEQAYELVFGTVSDFMLENSFGRTWLNGEVHGWFTLPFVRPTDPYTTCKQTVVSAAAQQAAQDAGIDLSAFDRYIYVFPQTSCFPSGTGTVGGSPSESWINGYYFHLKTVAHEFGHNLGLYHAGAQDCEGATLSTDCRISPYGDTMDIMGNKSTGHFSAYKKERLGWLGPDSGTIATAFSGGTYMLEAYESSPRDAPKALKVFKDASPDSGEPRWYYIEFRQGLGFDNFLEGNANVLNGVVVRIATETGTPSPVSSLLLDMTPESSSYDWDDPALAFEQSFTDPVSGVELTSHAGVNGTVLVEVGIGEASCLSSMPVLSVSPAEGQWVAAGSPVSYTVGLTNTDSAACDAATFTLSPSLPAGWLATVHDPALTLYPGMAGEITLTIASPEDAPDGIYTFDVPVERISAAGATASAAVTYIVSTAATNQAPVARDDSAATSPRTPVVIEVLANDSDPENEPLIVMAATQGAQGSVEVNADGTVVYTPRGKSGGDDSFSYTVSDGHAEATANVHVLNAAKGDAPGGGNGKGKGGK